MDTQKPKVLVCTSVGRGKEYAASFLLEVARRLENVAEVLIVVDGIPTPEELNRDALRETEQVLVLAEPEEEVERGIERVGRVREASREYALHGDFTHLYWHDADMLPPEDIIICLLEHEAPAVTGLYNMRGHPRVALPAAPTPSRFQPSPLNGLETLPREEAENLYRVAHFGMGCMLVSRAALDIPFASPADLLARHVTEDVAWCNDFTAATGENVLLDTSLSCWHVDADGSANRLEVGEEVEGAIWQDTPHFVNNNLGEWERGVARTDLAPAQLATLGPGFVVGHFPRLSLQIRRLEEIEPNGTNGQKYSGGAGD